MAPIDLTGTLVADRFKLERLAGQGGMGAVYRAHDTRSGQTVAFKSIVLDVKDWRRFEREVAVLAEIDHPAVVGYVAHGKAADEMPYLVMRWLEGPSLAESLKRGALSVADTVAIGIRIAQGLQALHERGVVHRDVKPRNIVLVGDDCASTTLVDLGIAHRSGQGTALTRTGMIVGTLGYMAPEQVRAERTIDARADLFALGCVLHECLLGKCPFTGPTPASALTKVMLDEVASVATYRHDVPEALSNLIDRLLAKSPDERPRDAAQVS